MKVITKPQVYLIGRQTVNDVDLDRFLADHGVVWQTDTEVPAEKLAEVAGRTCYMSFERPRPGGNSAYLSHILQVGHGCYDVETEVLTATGWKAWPDVSGDDRLATLTLSGAVEYRQPVRVVRAEHSGRMYRVEGAGVDLLVTPNHRMFVCPTTTRLGRKRLFSGYRCVPAEELGTTSHAYLKTGRWEYEPDQIQPTFSPDELRVLGFAIGDGYYAGCGQQVRFRLRRERKICWLRAVATRLGWRLQEREDRFTLDAEPIVSLLRQMYTEDGDKRIPQSEVLLTRHSLPALEGLFEGLMQADGHEGRTGDSFDTTSQVLADQFQQLCLHVGLAANRGYTVSGESRASFGDKPLTRLHVVRRNLRPEVNKWADQAGRSFWVDDWSGEVFCAEMPPDTARVVYVRRNGQPVWCGNSVLEHSVWNFLFTGVSRSLTHELIRHRAGFGYSQLSQRYVDESVDEYVEPDCIAADPELHEVWLQSITKAHQTYVTLVARLLETAPPELTGTDKRKWARQAARSVLPNATETKIFVTANARALRHFIEMRGNKHADTEIRKLANAVLILMRQESPNLFGDYWMSDLLDGTHEAATYHRKV